MLNNEFPPLGGGTGTVNRALLRCWSKVPDLEFDLVTSALGKREESEPFTERVRIFRVPVGSRIIHHSSNRELLTYAARAFFKGRQLIADRAFDLCFAWSAVPAGVVALALKHLYHLPYLVRVCGPDIPGFELRYGSLYPVLTPIIRAVWRAAHAVVAKCEKEAQMIRACDPAVRILLVPNGVDIGTFQPALIPDEGSSRLLCVARLIERKGQAQLISAMKRLVESGLDVELELVGTGDAEPHYRAQVNELRLGERVRFAGYVPREKMPARYYAAHIFVLPSYNEGMSVSTLEAMAAGLPVVVTRTGGTTELVTEGINGLTFDWGDVDTLTRHLAALVKDRTCARQMGRAGRARAAQFSWQTPSEMYLQLFDTLSPRQERTAS